MDTVGRVFVSILILIFALTIFAVVMLLVADPNANPLLWFIPPIMIANMYFGILIAKERKKK